MKSNNIKIFCLAFLCGLSSVLIFFLYFKLWAFDLNYPITNPFGDGICMVAIVQSIIDNGWIADSKRFGYLNSESFFTFDHYPLFSEFIHFSIFKIFSLFTQNPYLIVNLFFILTFFLISFFAFISLRVFQISNLISFFLAIYYALLIYHIKRSTEHLFLSNYSCIPLIMIVGYWFYYNKINFIIKKNQKFYLDINRYFVFSVLIIIYCSGTGFYYAFYSALMILFIWFIKSLKDANFFSKNLAIFLVLSFVYFIIFLYLYIPYFVFVSNSNINLFNRSANDNFFYSLKLIGLLIPNNTHLLDFFRDISKIWQDSIREFENSLTYMGILLGIIFLTMIMWIIAKANGYLIFEKTIKRFALNSKDIEKISLISSLNFFGILFVIPGGLIMPSLNVVFLRSNARFVVIIAFLCLITLGILADSLIKKSIYKNSKLLKIVLVLLYVFSIFDILGKRSFYFDISYPINLLNKSLIFDDKSSKDSQVNIIKLILDGNKRFIKKIESELPEGSPIFIMPYAYWPEWQFDSYSSLFFYIYSKKLIWSYPLVRTKNSVKVEKIIFRSSSYDDFIKELKKLGFKGLVLNNLDYENCLDNEFCVKLNIRIKNLKEKILQTKSESLIRSDHNLFIFIKI